MSLFNWCRDNLGAQGRALSLLGFERERKRRYAAVFDNEDGRWVLADLANVHGVFNELPPLDSEGRLDSHKLALFEGKRSVVVNIIKYVKLPLLEEEEPDDGDQS